MRKRGKPRPIGPNPNLIVPIAPLRPIFVCGVEARDSEHARDLYAAQYEGTSAGTRYGIAHHKADEKERLACLQEHLDGGGTHYTWLAKQRGF